MWEVVSELGVDERTNNFKTVKGLDPDGSKGLLADEIARGAEGDLAKERAARNGISMSAQVELLIRQAARKEGLDLEALGRREEGILGARIRRAPGVGSLRDPRGIPGNSGPLSISFSSRKGWTGSLSRLRRVTERVARIAWKGLCPSP